MSTVLMESGKSTSKTASNKLTQWAFALLLAVVAYYSFSFVGSLPSYVNLIGAIVLGLLTFLNFGMSSLFYVASLIYVLSRVRLDVALVAGAAMVLIWAFGKGDRRILTLAFVAPLCAWIHLAYLPVLLAFAMSGLYGGLYVGLATAVSCVTLALIGHTGFDGVFLSVPHLGTQLVQLPANIGTAVIQKSSTGIAIHTDLPLWFWKFLYFLTGSTFPSTQVLAGHLQGHTSANLDLFRYITASKVPFTRAVIESWLAMKGMVSSPGLRDSAILFISPITLNIYSRIHKTNLNRLYAGGVALITVGVVAGILGQFSGGVIGAILLSFVAYEILMMAVVIRETKASGNVAIGKGLLQTVRYLVRSGSAKEEIAASSLSEAFRGQEAIRELDNVIGIKEVKEFVREIQSLARVQRLRKKTASGSGQTWHMILTGNPGTGKTTIARIIGKVLKEEGILTSGQFIETSRADLVAPYIGQTAPRTMAKVNEAIGGVLFIDEAYSLVRGSDDKDFGREAIDTLVKAMEDHRDNLVIILAGYPEEMEEFLQSNPGLRSRFPHQIEFPDYSPEEILQIMKRMIQDKKFVLDAAADPIILKQIERSKLKGKSDDGNGRLARNLLDTAVRQQSKRLSGLAKSEMTKTMLNTLTKEDFGYVEETVSIDSVMHQLDNMIGLDEVKQQIRVLHSLLLTHNKRRAAGLQVEAQNLHTIFTGNPGTGKTTVARMYAEMLYSMDFLKRGHLVEADRSTLVAGYQGQTAIKVREVFEKALGGVLFIDEAYTLYRGSGDSFGIEATETLMKLMEDYRSEIVVILAGYQEQTEAFLTANPGLSSRFANRIRFPDYTNEELKEIAKREYARRGYQAEQAALDVLGARLQQELDRSQNFGNARSVVNFVESTIRNHAIRVAQLGNPSVDELSTIIAADVAADSV